MNFKRILAFINVLICVYSCKASNANNSWFTFFRDAKALLQACPNKSINTFSLWLCIKKSSLDLFDKMTSTDIIPITEQIQLVKYDASSQLDHSTLNAKNLTKNPNIKWIDRFTQRSFDLLSTYDLQVNLPEYNIHGDGRARHRRNQMLPIMVFAMTAFGMVIVPIGFQLLAMLGGKALLLSKMALFLASVSGIRRVASSGVNFGLYHADPYPHPGLERNEYIPNRPRNLL